jgi:hypothetical protein
MMDEPQVLSRNVFSRGASKADMAERQRRVQGAFFSRARARAACRFPRDTISGEIAVHKQAHAPLPDALANAAESPNEPQRAPQLKGKQVTRIRLALCGTAALGNDDGNPGLMRW